MRTSRLSWAASVLPMVLVMSCDALAPNAPEPAVPLAFDVFYAPAADYAFPRSELVVRSQAEWETLWTTLQLRRFPKSDAPVVDFETETLVLASIGTKGNGGYTVAITDVGIVNGALRVRVHSREPGSSCVTTQSLVNPVVIARVPRWDGEVEFVRSRRVQQC